MYDTCEQKSCNNCHNYKWFSLPYGDEEVWVRSCQLIEARMQTPNYDRHVPVCSAWIRRF